MSDARTGRAPIPRIGSDESGKGDYFGPLVVAAVAVRRAEEEALLAGWGVADSKRLSDLRCRELAGRIAHGLAVEVVSISPYRYNQLHERMGRNLNRLLAWAHARALENLLARVAAPLVVVDQFAADTAFLRRYLFEQGRTVEVIQRPRAEADMAVAAASVMARARFLQELERLSARVGVRLPKGATHVEPVARELAARGLEVLATVAKLHFATTARVTGRNGLPTSRSSHGQANV